MTTSAKNSRFSTLKVFNFSSSSSSATTASFDEHDEYDNDDDDALPPPPPPKDPYYLYNRSLSSLSPDPQGSPSPNSPQAQYARRPSPGPSNSAMSLSAGYATSPPLLDAPASVGRKGTSTFGKGLFKFGRRSPKGSDNADLESLKGQDDDNISLPWNFSVSTLAALIIRS